MLLIGTDGADTDPRTSACLPFTPPYSGGMSVLLAVLPYLIGLGLLSVVVTLFAGFTSMTRGGDFNARWGNKLMRWRVVTQAVTIALFLVYIVLIRMQ